MCILYRYYRNVFLILKDNYREIQPGAIVSEYFWSKRMNLKIFFIAPIAQQLILLRILGCLGYLHPNAFFSTDNVR